MNKLVIIFSILAAIVLAFGCSTTRPPPTSAFHDDWTGLFSATKGFAGTRSYYLGSDDKWSYFKTTGEPLSKPIYRKVETSSMNLPHTFPFGEGKPYRIQLSNFRVNQKLAPIITSEPTTK